VGIRAEVRVVVIRGIDGWGLCGHKGRRMSVLSE
jgi:hypothetical protein